MKKSEAIKKMKAEAKRNVLKFRIYDAIYLYGLRESVSRIDSNLARGKAFGLLDAIKYLDDEFDDMEYYLKAVEDAEMEIAQATKAKTDFERLYVMAGHSPGMYKQDIEEYRKGTLCKTLLELGIVR